MDVSRWYVPALVYSAGLSVFCVSQWPERAPFSLDMLLAIVLLNSTMAFALASVFEIVQWLRARDDTRRNWWSAAIVAAGIAFSWSVGRELVGAVSYIEGVGYPHAMAAILAAGLVLALNGLRANAFGSRIVAVAVGAVTLIVLVWAQQRYRMQMREARYAGVSAAFLMITGAIALRLVERVRPSRQSSGRAIATVLLPLVMVSCLSLIASEFATKQLYFAGLFPGRFVFALHLPQVVARSNRRRADDGTAVAYASATGRRGVHAPRTETPASERGSAPARLVVVALVDAARYDAFLHYAQRTSSKLNRFWRESCFAGPSYSPASDTASTLSQMLLRPGTSKEYWPKSVRKSGVATTVILDGATMTLLDRRLPSGFSSLFENAIRLQRSKDSPPKFQSVSAAVAQAIRTDGKQQLVWAHFFDVHEWLAESAAKGDRKAYSERISLVGDELAEMLRVLESNHTPSSVLVVSDHGEGVDHFSTRTHGEFLYEPLVRVPLMVWTNAHPCSEGLRALRASPPPPTLVVGRIVLEELGIVSDPQLPSISEISATPTIMRTGIQDAVLQWPQKLIVSPWFAELYNLENDPNEQNNLAATQRKVVSEMNRLLP